MGQLPACFRQPRIDIPAPHLVAAGLETLDGAQVASPKCDVACLFGAQPGDGRSQVNRVEGPLVLRHSTGPAV